jgi:WD40-like Beta Propeller Repeat
VAGPGIARDDLELVYGDLIRAVRATDTAPWIVVGPIAELDSNVGDSDPTLSADGLTIYFDTYREGAERRIYTATRPERGAAFGAAVPFDPANQAGAESVDPEISADGRELYFGSNRLGGWDVFVVTR